MGKSREGNDWVDGVKKPLTYPLPEGEREMEEMKADSNLSNGRGRWEKTPPQLSTSRGGEGNGGDESGF
jgi:hypothetical protein